MTRHRIIFLGKLPPPYIGPAVAAKIILESSLKDDFELIHLDTSDHRDLKTLGKIDVMNILIAIKQYWLLFYFIIRYRPKAVYIPSQQDTIGYLRDTVFILISKAFGTKVICHLRGGYFKTWYDSTSKFMKRVVKIFQKMVDVQIVLGNNLRYMFDFLMPDEKIIVIPNGGNYSIPHASRFDNKIKILYLGNFIRTKGVIDTLEASKYVKNIDKTEFDFAGEMKDNSVSEEIKIFIEQNKNININIIGSVIGEKKFELLVSCDIFVFPTYYPFEGHPWVIIEAMAAGLPVITTNHAAISESVQDGVNGFLVKIQSPGQIADKINFLIDNPGIRKKMGQESRRLYLEKFTEKTMIEGLGKVFKSL